MQQPLSYPFYMGTPSMPWGASRFHLPSPHQPQFLSSYPINQFSSPFVPPRTRNSRLLPSYSNTRYDHLKQSTSGSTRRSVDAANRPYRSSTFNNSFHSLQYRPTKTKSVSDLHQLSKSTSAHLSKAQSWHMMAQARSSNLSAAYATEIKLTPKHHRKHSPRKKKKMYPQRHLSSSPPKRKPSFNMNHRKRFVPAPERGVVRISTLDEMPINNNNQNIDRSSTKGSISNSSKPRRISKGTNSIKNRKIKNDGAGMDSDGQSSSSSSYSTSSLQQRLNGSLRNDPLIIAAMENFRQFRRTSGQTKSSASHRRELSRDSLFSDSTLHSSASPTRSRSQSQSSFTSLERADIRHLIKTVKTKSLSSSSPIPSSDQSITGDLHSSTSTLRPRKSSLTEELDREFSKLRALNPTGELTKVTPSLISKRKKTLEKPSPNIPPLPTFDELLRQVKLRPIQKSKKEEDIYENPLSCVPVPVPRCSPTPPDEEKIEETKHEYAIPIKKSEEKSPPPISHFQPTRNSNNISGKRTSRSLSMFNWFHGNSTNQLPATFQPNRVMTNQNEYEPTVVKENIYTSDVEVHLPTSTIEKFEDNSLQMHLDNQTILTDELFSDYKQTTNSSSILNDLSHLFGRKHKVQNKLHTKNQRCSIM